MDILPVADSIIILFLLMGIGFAASKAKFLDRNGSKALSSFLVNIALPCLVVISMQIPVNADTMEKTQTTLTLALVFFAISIAVAVIVPMFIPAKYSERGVFSFMLVFSNLGFMGIPVTQAIFGTDAVFYTTLFMLPFNLLVFTIGILMLRPDMRMNQCIKAIPLLLAVRDYEIYCQDENGAVTYRFDRMKQSIEQYKYFMRKTGLFDMLENHIISNLYDYVMGVEVGLGSNGRKNRGGHQMEDLVESFIKKAGFVKDKTYFKEMYLNEIEHKWNVNLSAISAEGTTTKRWDFVIKTNNRIYVIETNFYSSGGSKLNETARSYKTLAIEAKEIQDFDFVWITDGGGWTSARRNLEETFDVMDCIFNIKDMEDGLFEKF